MNIFDNMNNFNVSKSYQNLTVQQEKKQPVETKTKPYKKDILDIFSTKVVNQNDIKDMVTVPRAIFKGYLCFTAGTAINAIAGLIKNKKVANPLLVLGSLSAIYGTFNFVKPFLIRNEDLTKKEK